jgi:antitoxin CptB
MNFNDPEFKRMRWQCRRGMLELDLLLSEFLETRYPTLDPSTRKSFARLLEQPDQNLQRWLLGDGANVEPELQQIIQTLRDQGVDRQ